MKIRTSKTHRKDLHKHETKQHILFKFISVIAVLLGYFFFMSYKYGAEQGFLVTILTWSFFVLCTPVADAGFLIDFPLRIILRVKMMYSEIIVWFIAISLNVYTFFSKPEIYNTTHLLSIFRKILAHPFPFWGIILISALGTFLSVYFGDELINKVKHTERSFYHKHKYNYRFIVMVFVLAVSFALYAILAKRLGIEGLL